MNEWMDFQGSLRVGGSEGENSWNFEAFSCDFNKLFGLRDSKVGGSSNYQRKIHWKIEKF